jgi:hypothetical protein
MANCQRLKPCARRVWESFGRAYEERIRGPIIGPDQPRTVGLQGVAVGETARHASRHTSIVRGQLKTWSVSNIHADNRSEVPDEGRRADELRRAVRTAFRGSRDLTRRRQRRPKCRPTRGNHRCDAPPAEATISGEVRYCRRQCIRPSVNAPSRPPRGPRALFFVAPTVSRKSANRSTCAWTRFDGCALRPGAVGGPCRSRTHAFLGRTPLTA